MLFGIPPFYDKNIDNIKNNILNNEVQFPNDINVSDNAKDLILKLLNKEYDKRLGFNKGFDEIKKHEFFKDINFDDLLNKKIKAPYKPNLKINLENIEKN
jgi:serum/glucocorticoid-regulated kinase 2